MLLRELAAEIAHVYQSLFTQGLKDRALPVDISPQFKKDDRHLPVNYRSVSLISIT